jgi:hypothetical protein
MLLALLSACGAAVSAASLDASPGPADPGPQVSLSARQLTPDSEGDEVLLVFMFCGMMIGAVITYVLSRVKANVPYTVLVFLSGVLLFLLVDTDMGFGRLGDSVRRWKDIDPELLLYIFLPALLFGEAMNLSWYVCSYALLSIL